MHLYPGQNAWFPFVKCLESRAPGKKQPFTDVAPCANETGLDLPAIMDCASGAPVCLNLLKIWLKLIRACGGGNA